MLIEKTYRDDDVARFAVEVKGAPTVGSHGRNKRRVVCFKGFQVQGDTRLLAFSLQ